MMTVEVVICGPPAGIHRRRYTRCHSPVCRGALRRVVQSHRGLWYPSVQTCCRCGDSWAEGEYLERPFRRGWRIERSRQARKDWDAALSPEWWDLYMHGDMDEQQYWNRIFEADHRDRWAP